MVLQKDDKIQSRFGDRPIYTVVQVGRVYAWLCNGARIDKHALDLDFRYFDLIQD
jgi:hypothetical protein